MSNFKAVGCQNYLATTNPFIEYFFFSTANFIW